MKLSQKSGGVLLSYATMFANVIVKFLYTPILLRLLGQSEYGLYSLVISIVGYLAILDLGFGSTVTRYAVQFRSANDKDGLKRLYGTLSIIYIIIGVIAFLVCIGIILSAEDLFGDSMSPLEIEKLKFMIFLCGINLLFRFPLQIASSVLVAYERFIFKNGIFMLSIILEPIVMLLMLYFLNIDSVGAILVVTIFNLLTSFVYYLYSMKNLDYHLYFKHFDKKLIGSLLSFSLSMFLLMVFEQLQYNSGQFILGMKFGSDTIAIWGVTMIFVLNYRSVSSAITNVFMPSFFNSTFSDNSQDSNSQIIKMTRIQCYLTFTILTNFLLFGSHFIRIWAGENYIESYYAAVIIMIPMTMCLLLDFCYLYQMAVKQLAYRVITLFLGFFIAFFVVDICWGINLMTYAGIIGISMCIGQVVCVLFYISKKMTIRIPLILKNVFRIAIVPILLGLVSYIIDEKFSIQDGGLLSYLLMIFIFNIILLGGYFVFAMTPEEKKMIKLS